MALTADEHNAYYSNKVNKRFKQAGFVVGALFGIVFLTVPITILTLVCGILLRLAYIAGELAYRYQPLFEIYLDHCLLVIDEPIIVGSYRLNDLFSQFDQAILKEIHGNIFSQSLVEFNAYLAEFLKSDYDKETKKLCMELVMHLPYALFDPSLQISAIQSMREWMDDYPLKSETKA